MSFPRKCPCGRLYSYGGIAGCVQQRRCRQNGRLIGVYNGAQGDMDTDGGTLPWSTVCEEHGQVIAHPTLALALGHASDPEGWCEQCMAERRRSG